MKKDRVWVYGLILIMVVILMSWNCYNCVRLPITEEFGNNPYVIRLWSGQCTYGSTFGPYGDDKMYTSGGCRAGFNLNGYQTYCSSDEDKFSVCTTDRSNPPLVLPLPTYTGFTKEEGKNYAGAELGTVPTIEACAARCKTDANCFGFVVQRDNLDKDNPISNCWLKGKDAFAKAAVNDASIASYKKNEIVPTEDFPLIVYSGANYEGQATQVSMTSAPQLNQYVWSFKLQPGYYVTLTNHICIATPGGCTNSATIAIKEYVVSNPNFSPCSASMNCNGATILPGTLAIKKVTAWTNILISMSQLPDWTVFSYGFGPTVLRLTASLYNGYSGIYVGYYFMPNGNWGVWNELTDGSKEVAYKDTNTGAVMNSHYSDDIIQQIRFNTWNVKIDTVGDGHGGQIFTMTRATNPDLFVNPSVKKTLMTLRAPGNRNVVEQNGDYLSGNRYISIWVEYHAETP